MTMSENLMMSVTVDEYNSLSGSEVDASILLPIVNYLFIRLVEQGKTHEIVDSVDASVSDTGIDFHQTLNALERMGVPMDPTWFEREYNVTFVVPVSVTVMVEASTAGRAEMEATDALDRNGLEAYMMDYSVHYDAEITEVTEV
jgi:hypothetical protein